MLGPWASPTSWVVMLVLLDIDVGLAISLLRDFCSPNYHFLSWSQPLRFIAMWWSIGFRTPNSAKAAKLLEGSVRRITVRGPAPQIQKKYVCVGFLLVLIRE